MPDKSVIIIGAGIAGLAAGCYAQMNGYHARVYEMHSQPGGMCTTWKRSGFTIDGSVHFLIGSAPGGLFHQWWREVGVLPGRDFVHHEAEMRYERADGRVLTLYNDIDRLHRHLLELAPADVGVIEEFITGMRFFLNYQPPIDAVPELMGPLDGIRFLINEMPKMQKFQKWAKISIRSFARRFTEPLLREGFLAAMHPDFPMTLLMMSLAWQAQKNAGYPIGGSLPIARAMEKRLCSLGGSIMYHAKVAKIVTEGKQAVGIRLDDGREDWADYVISAADGHSTLFNMLDERFLDRKTRAVYRKFRLFPSLLYISIGVNGEVDLPHTVSGTAIQLEEPVTIGDQVIHHLPVQTSGFDPTMTAGGKTVLTSAIWAEFPYWNALRADREAYEAKKQEIAQTIIRLLDRRWLGLAERVEMTDVATPLTYERYTGSWQGSTQGWMPTTETAMAQIRNTLPRLKNFYMVGQWTAPGGGLPTGLRSGRNVIRVICKKDKRPFTASEG